MKEDGSLLRSGANVEQVKLAISPVTNLVLNFIVPLICIGISCALGFFVIYPAYTQKPELDSKIAQLKTKEATLSNKLDNLKKIVDFSSVIKENSTAVNKVLVNEAAVPQLLTQIDLITKEVGFEVDRLSYSGGDSGGDASGAPTSQRVISNMSASGNYDQLVSFFKLIENSSRLVLVDNFRYSASTSGEDTSVLSFTFVLSSPYLNVKSDAVTDDPLQLDISDKGFLSFMDKLKKFKYYDISIDTTELPESAKQSTESAPVAQ